MSYARKGPESDVYVYSDGVKYICHECRVLFDPEQDECKNVVRDTAREMLEHLVEEHRGICEHKVPERALERLRADACDELGNVIPTPESDKLEALRAEVEQLKGQVQSQRDMIGRWMAATGCKTPEEWEAKRGG